MPRRQILTSKLEIAILPVSDMPIYWFAAPGGSRAAAFLREGLLGILLLSEPRQAWTKAR
jgi:hypothetical protein